MLNLFSAFATTMKNISSLILFPLFVIISSCATQKFIETDLYFGLSKDDGTIISDSAWNVFVENNVPFLLGTL